MVLTAAHHIQQLNDLLTQQQTRLNQPISITFLSSYMDKKADSYQGQPDRISELLEKNKNHLENRAAVVADVLFILQQASKHLIQIEEIESLKKNELASILSKNISLLTTKYNQLLNLDNLYKSLIIEPAIAALPDGEKANFNQFQVIADPITSLTSEQARLLKDQWFENLHALEKELSTPIELSLIY